MKNPQNCKGLMIFIFFVCFSGLTSLGRIFPNLRIIGGDSLIMNYALVIYQNDDLRSVGLTKLTVIKNGGVRIMENSQLCYARTINWNNMIVGNLRDVILDTSENQCTDECSVADEEKCSYIEPNVISCWNATKCQSFCPYHKFANGSFGPGCTDSGEICHEYCLGGCTEANDPSACHTCRNVEINGICAASCPDGLFEHQGRRCLTKEGCYSLRPMSSRSMSRDQAEWKAFHGRCHYDCPSGYEEDPTNRRNCVKCDGHCPKKCQGDESIDSVGAALKFRGCNIIDGYLEIEMRIGKEMNAEKFSEAFGELEEVTGYLNIRFSSVFTSLHMFKKLRVIHGNQLYRNTYALVVFDNSNLRELFNLKNRTMKILNGIVQFQNNRMLCLSKINAFLKHVGLRKAVGDNDVGTYSNGDKAVCDETPLEVDVVSVFSNGFNIRWTPFNTTDMDYRKFIGYQIFFKKVDKIDEDMSIDEDRSVCGDSWKMQFSDPMQSSEIDPSNNDKNLTSNTGEMVAYGIEANTLYAFYVQTRIVNHPGARNAISKVKFVKTHYGNPEPPRIRLYRARGPDRFEIQWDVPLKPEGVITHYRILWQIVTPSEGLENINACNEEVQKRPTLTVSKKANKGVGTCSIEEGCCDCSLLHKANRLPNTYNNMDSFDTEELEKAREEKSAFENSIQNKVFRQRNSTDPVHNDYLDKIREKREALELYESMDSDMAYRILQNESIAYNISYLNVSDPAFLPEFRSSGKINITGTSLLLVGLPHFTEYSISIAACQDVNGPDNQCSSRPAWLTIRTAAIPENDQVLPETVRVWNVTDGKENDCRINWLPPKDPNGEILAYRAQLYRDDVEQTPLFKCIQAVTLAGIGKATVVKNVLELNNAFMTTRTMIITGLSLLAAIILLGISGYYGMHYFLGHKFEEYYWRQTISANPEYLSQIDVYKKDEWELRRSDIELLDEIGRGTFGQVFRGIGKNTKSASDVVFGDCAVKTMPDSATNRERLHFLIEASVMKQFNTACNGMMEKGNLRDFLRAHRPDAEENVNKYPLPDPNQYFTWAAQIVDGMAYLESIKFCHRDLAARNCMVHADETIKIGDFGIARDIYYHEYYQPTGKRLMPVRWMSLESLKDGKFTVKSDIWSYGIVLYEMLTLGQQPYAGLGNDQVFNYIGVQRRVMVRPMDCPDHWYNLMRCCWRYDPRERPCFWQVVDHLQDKTTPAFRQVSFALNTEILERTNQEEPYAFETDWPEEPHLETEEEFPNFADEIDDFDSVSQIKYPLDNDSMASQLTENFSDGCSCSTYSDTETTAEHDNYVTRNPHHHNHHRRHETYDYLNSPVRHDSNDMDREKYEARDRERLLSSNNREDEYVLDMGTDVQPQHSTRAYNKPAAPTSRLSIGDADDLISRMEDDENERRLRREQSNESTPSARRTVPANRNQPPDSPDYSFTANPSQWP
ncbi:Receptor protein-tyrosine kinase [Aphelenchoides besseyi]|nr:Receptor protein-tyrosine kinase [Aphelenchoides besseyi]